MEPGFKSVRSGTQFCALSHWTPLSLGKWPCCLQSCRMVAQTISTEIQKEKGHIKAGELGDFHQSISQIFSFMHLSHSPGWFLHRQECVLFPLYSQCQAQRSAHSNHSKIFTQKAHRTHQCWLQGAESGLLREWSSYWETVNSLVGRFIQPSKHAVILKDLCIFQPFFQEKSALGDSLKFACNFVNAKVQ